MTDKKIDRFIIVGGGIGGLAAALGLAQHGIKSIVLEAFLIILGSLFFGLFS